MATHHSRRERRYAPFWRKRKFRRTVQGILLAAAVVYIVGSYCVSTWGGKGIFPTWGELFGGAGISNGVPGAASSQTGSDSADGTQTASDGGAAVHFIDVGQGDAVLVEQDGEFGLIDCGTEDSETALLSYLEQAGVKKLDVLVMTHPHADHIGSMDAVLEKIPVDKLVLPQLEKAANYPTTAGFEHVITAAEKKNVDTAEAQEGNVYTVGGASLTVVGTGVKSEGYNDISLALLFQYGDFRFLDTGDGEKAAEQALLDSGRDLSATVFKAAHHGSSTSNTLALLQAVKPGYVVVSCGLNNDYGHPHQEALDHFAAVGAQVFRTDLQGSVVVRSSASGEVTVSTQKEAAA